MKLSKTEAKKANEKIHQMHKDEVLEGLLVKYSTLALRYSNRDIPLTEFDQGKASVMRQIKNLFK